MAFFTLQIMTSFCNFKVNSTFDSDDQKMMIILMLN